MPPTVPDTEQSHLTINVYDGTRNLVKDGTSVLYTIIDGNQKQLLRKSYNKSSKDFDVPFYDNFGDQYTLIAWAKDYQQAGFAPVHLTRDTPTTVDLMLIPNKPEFNFANAPWDIMKLKLPFIASDITDSKGRDRYETLMEEKPKALASLLNLTTAMKQIFLANGTPLDYLKEVIWDDTLAQDRFFCYCDATLIDQVRDAANKGLFAPEFGSSVFHAGATASWKQIQFGEANVQLTFHENEKQTIDGTKCIVVEPDIDYEKDIAAHTVLEVIPNTVTKGLTNPEVVYVLRWIAGRRAGVPEFAPPYVIV